MDNRQREQYLEELEAKIDVLQDENSQLAERAEDTLLLGLISERINGLTDAPSVLQSSLENISLLKDIPFCACGELEDQKFTLQYYYHSGSNSRLPLCNGTFPAEISHLIAADPLFLSGEQCQEICRSVGISPEILAPTSILFIPARGKQRTKKFFCFVNTSSSERLTEMQTLLSRIVDIISSRLDNITLLSELNLLNSVLDKKVQDRTRELNQANTILRKSESKFRGLFNGAQDMIHFLDKHGRILDANPIELETLQYSKEELVGKKIFELIAPESREHSVKALQKLASGKEICNLNTVMLKKDGVRIDVEVNAVPEFLNGQLYRVRSILRNITDRKQLEADREKIRKLESVGILAGGIAHDFNNILAAILGNLNLARVYTKPTDKIQDLLENAEKASLRARDLTQQLLTFAKGGEPIKKACSIIDLIQDSVRFVLHGTDISCDFHFSEDLWPVEIDAGQISQVIQNLVLNARQAITDGGTIQVGCQNLESVGSNIPITSDICLKISISDHGCGIAPNVLDKIFDPYFSTKQKGSGLGLAVSHSIIRKHRGHINVESTEGTGTCFSIYLPATKTVSVAPPTTTAQGPGNGHGRVIIMDDDKMVRDIVQAMLNNFGYEVIPAIDGEEAVTLYEEASSMTESIDIIIMDLTIPGAMGGKEAAIKVLSFDPDAKLIVSSGYSNDPIMAHPEDYGFRAAIEKPYQLQNLLHTVSDVIGYTP